MFVAKRIYEPADEGDGYRVLVDRLWPRGVSRERAHLDCWLKSIAPSDETRERFCHDPAKFDEFRAAYLAELALNANVVDELRDLEHAHGKVTLLYGARDAEHNQAVVLLEVLGRKRARIRRQRSAWTVI